MVLRQITLRLQTCYKRLPYVHLPACLLVSLLGSTAVTGADASDKEFNGLWMTEDGGSVVEIRPCGRFLCGYLVAFEGDDPPLPLEKRPLCDTRLLGGLRYQENGLGGGWLYDMEAGSTFDLKLWRNGEDLKLRAYLNYERLGQTLTWTRPAGAIKKCIDRL